MGSKPRFLLHASYKKGEAVMPEEILKRLDELMARLKHPAYEAFGVLQPNTVMRLWRDWQALRVELVDGCCENCGYWGQVTHYCAKAKTHDADLEVLWWADNGSDIEGGAELETTANFRCSHFTKKENKA